MPQFHALSSYKQLFQHVLVGCSCASFWRGAWYILDDHLFPENAEHSAIASLVLGTAGMGASQGLVARATKLAQKTSRPLPLAAARFGALYTVAVSCVLVWRGTWIGWDCLYERFHHEDVKAIDKGHASKSGLLSHATAVTLLLATGLFASVLAPPAQVSVLRDFAVRGRSSYKGPAQAIVNSMFQKGTSRTLSTVQKKPYKHQRTSTTTKP